MFAIFIQCGMSSQSHCLQICFEIVETIYIARPLNRSSLPKLNETSKFFENDDVAYLQVWNSLSISLGGELLLPLLNVL